MFVEVFLGGAGKPVSKLFAKLLSAIGRGAEAGSHGDVACGEEDFGKVVIAKGSGGMNCVFG